jgi:hypothetical protein
MGTMSWPNDDYWKALAAGERFEQRGKPISLDVVDCGELVAHHGRLVVCDPFTGLDTSGNPIIRIPPGRYPVKITLADVSGTADGSHLRNAYATLFLSDADEVSRRVLTRLWEGEKTPEIEEGHYEGFPVDGGAACFVDEGSLSYGMPDPMDWYDVMIGDDDCWFSRMDDPNHIHYGIANVPLPLATDGANTILFGSGWGDGVYPVVGGYDADGKLVRVHIDFFVIDPSGEDDSDGESSS